MLRVHRGSKAEDNLSRTSTANETVGSDRGNTRASIDRALDKLKDNIRSSGEDAESRRDSGDSHKLSRLISKTKRKIRKDATERGRRDDNRPSTAGGPVGSETSQTLVVDPSQESLGLNHSGGSSLLTEDSDGEA